MSIQGTKVCCISNHGKSLPDWTAPENLRWAWWGWEPLPHRHRIGGRKIAFLGDSRWVEQWHDRIFSEKTVQQMKALGVNFAVTHFFKGMGLRAERTEMLQTRRFVRLCHKHGIKVAGYTQFGSLYYETFLKEQPGSSKWIGKQLDGDFTRYGGNVYYRWKPCVNSKEFIGYLKRVITYGAKEIGLDAFHFDNAHAEPCYCADCRMLFREYLEENIKDEKRLGFLGFRHVELPPYIENHACVADPLYQEWIRFRVESLTNAWRELYLHIKKTNPELCMITNSGFPRNLGWANRLSFHPRATGAYTDMMWAENGNFPCMDGKKHVSQIRAYKIAEACGYRVISTAWKLKNGGIRCPENKPEVQLGLAEAAAFGGTVGTTWALRTTVGQGVVVDNRKLADPLGKYIGFFNQHRDLYAKARTDSKVAILHSFESFAYRAAQSSAKFMGMEQIFVSGGVPYDVLFEEDISLVGQYRLLIIAGQECLSDKTVSAIREYVHAGGKVFVTGESGACDERGLAREEKCLADMANGKTVIFDKNSGVDEAMKDTYTSAIPLPKDAAAVFRKVRKMLDDKDIPFSVSAPQGVCANWTKLPDGRNVLHLVNYNNEKKPVKVSVSFVPEIMAGRKYSIYMPEKGLAASGKLPVRITISGLDTYAVVEIARANS